MHKKFVVCKNIIYMLWDVLGGHEGQTAVAPAHGNRPICAHRPGRLTN